MEQKNFVRKAQLKTEIWQNSYVQFLLAKNIFKNGFGRQKALQWKLVLNFNIPNLLKNSLENMHLSSKSGIIFYISGRIIRFFRILEEEMWELCFKKCQHWWIKLLRKSTKKQTVVNVRTTGKWIERISQSKQTLH